MKQKKFFIGLASLVAAIGFTACSNDDADYQQRSSTGNVISLTSSMKGMRSTSDPQTTALNTENKVGVFVTSGTSSITNGDNNQHSVESTGALSTSNPMTYPDGSVNIYAYAPYQESWGVNTANTFSVKSDQSTDANYLASDLLYGVPASNPVSATNDPVSLNFTHMLSKINVIITKATGSNVNLANAVVKVINTMPTTTLNPSTGAIGDADGTATEITATTITSDLTAGDADSKATACAVIVPQSLAVGTQFLKITTADDKTLVGKLGTATTFESGESYNITISVGNVTEDETEVTLSIGSTSITTWNGNTIGLTAYGVGDYVLADGSFLKATDENFETKKNNAIAVIFSTEVSTTDDAAGYNAYAMSLTNYSSRQWLKTSSDTEWGISNTSNWSDAIGHLDGRTVTSNLLSSDKYSALTSENQSVFIANLSDFSVTRPNTTDFSPWFIPSIGQLIQFADNLGNAGLKNIEEDTNISSTSTEKFAGGTNNSAGYKTTSNSIYSSINNYYTAVGKTLDGQLYASISEYKYNDGVHFWQLTIKSDEVNIGRNPGLGNSARYVLPCIAIKLPAVAE